MKLLAKILIYLFNQLRKVSTMLILRRRPLSKYLSDNVQNRFLNSLLYELMIQDKARNEVYHQAITRDVNAHSKVMEIGTGDFAADT